MKKHDMVWINLSSKQISLLSMNFYIIHVIQAIIIVNTLQKLMEKQTYKSHTTRQLILHLLVRLKNTERLDFHPSERWLS